MRVEVDGVRLFVDFQGAKLRPDGPWLREVPTVVILHAGPGFEHALYKVRPGPALADLAQVVYYDQRGHGLSDRSTPEHWCLDRWADDVKVLCERLGIERPVLLGHGWGGMVALRAQSRWPGLAAKIACYGTPARHVPARSVAAFDRIGGARAGEAAHAFYSDPGELTFGAYLRECAPLLTTTPIAPEWVARAVWDFEVVCHWQRTESGSIDLREEAASIDVPVLLVHGEDDPQMPVEGAEELAAALPNARLVRFSGARHGVMGDAPRAVVELRRFVAE